MMIDVVGVSALFGRLPSLKSNSPTAPLGFAIFGPSSTRPDRWPNHSKRLAYFARVFIEDAALSIPGRTAYDWDPMALHNEMKDAGLLRRVDAAE